MNNHDNSLDYYYYITMWQLTLEKVSIESNFLSWFSPTSLCYRNAVSNQGHNYAALSQTHFVMARLLVLLNLRQSQIYSVSENILANILMV